VVNVSVPLSDAPAALIALLTKRAESSASPAPPRQKAHDGEQHNEAIRRYALAALDNQAKGVENAGKGTRNQALNNAALALGRLVGAGALSEYVVRAALENASQMNGLVAEDGIVAIRATISSGLRAGMARPTDLSKIGQRARSRRAGDDRGATSRRSQDDVNCQREPPELSGDEAAADLDPDQGDLNRRLALFPLTDLGNARRFVERFGSEFKWCQVIGWLVWDGTRWSTDLADSRVAKKVHETVHLIQAEADAIIGTPDDYEVKNRSGTTMRSAQIGAWCLTSQGSRHFGCIAKTAANYLEIPASALDADPMKINVANGTLVVARSEGDYICLKPHDPQDLITKIIPVRYDPAATCPQYDQFIAQVQPEPAARRFLHQWGGLCLTGDVSEQKLVVFWGQGKNGKSTLLETWDAVAGDYGKSCPIETFLDPNRARRGGEPTPDLAMLAGVRFLRTSEPERGSKLAEALIKLVTGGDAMQVRHLNRDFFELRPQFKLTISGNHRPQIRGADEGIWRRVILLPWSVTVEESKRDLHLVEKLVAEKSGILNRLLDGLRDWLDHRLMLPDAAVTATAAYRTDSDPLGRFLSACVVANPGKRVQSSALYAVFVAWARANGEKEWALNGFSQAMTERGFQKKHSDVIWWLDIDLTRQASDFPSQVQP
jgi:putative DNA primase/helicase